MRYIGSLPGTWRYGSPTHNSLQLNPSRPKYITPLREEIEEAVAQLGWTKGAMGQMPRLESFMKECLRMSPVGARE
jgi:hypothetical protein